MNSQIALIIYFMKKILFSDCGFTKFSWHCRKIEKKDSETNMLKNFHLTDDKQSGVCWWAHEIGRLW